MNAIEQAKAVVRAHETLVADADVDGVLGNMDSDVAFLAPDSPMVEGRDAVRRLYETLFVIGSWEFSHDYSSTSEIGDLVFLHGVARGTMTPTDQKPVPLSNNFMITMRRDADGRFWMWRAAFAPSGE